MKKNILYICPSSGVGGAETFIKSTAKHTDEKNFKNTYLLFKDGPLRLDLQDLGTEVIVLESSPRLSKPWNHLSVGRQIQKIIRETSIDLVHSTMAYGALFAALPTFRTAATHCWFQHGPASGWMDQVAGVLPHHGLFSNSEYTTQTQLTLEKPVSPLVSKSRKIFQIPLGTDFPHQSLSKTELKTRFLEKHNLPSNSVLVSMLCRIQPWKGIHQFVESFKDPRLVDSPFVGLIWGEAFKGSDYLQTLKETVKKHQLPILFMGLTKEPQKALTLSDVLVNASLQPEPFGLSIIEAMACKTAVIAPNQGGPQDIIQPNENGLLFQPGSPTSLADKILEFRDVENRLRLQEGAHQNFSKNFTATRMMKDLEMAYCELIEKGASTHA